jgi:hypothetical protein
MSAVNASIAMRELHALDIDKCAVVHESIRDSAWKLVLVMHIIKDMRDKQA